MHALASMRLSRKLTMIFSILLLAGCGQGDGPQSIAGTAATPLPEIPPGFCDAINFEILCPPVTIVNFNGGASDIIDNPDKSGSNSSDKVAQMRKFPDAPGVFFGGTALKLDAAVDFAAGKAYKVKVWSSRNVALTFKLEAGNPVDQFQSRELVKNHTGSSSWEELCFDFAANMPGLDVFGLVLIFDNGIAGAADTDPANWTFFYDDIAQVASCSGGGGGGGGTGTSIIPDAVVYATDPGVVEDLAPPGGTQNFGSGAVFMADYALDADYNPAFAVSSGEGYGAGVHVGFVAFTGYAPGFAAGYDNFVFKVKDLPAGTLEVKFFGGSDNSIVYDVTSYAGSGTLANGWYQVSIPVSEFAATIASNDGFLLGPQGDQGAPFTFLLTDIGFTGTGGGGGGGADPGIIPDDVVYATDPGQTVDLPPPVIDNFGSGSTFDGTYALDSSFNPVFSVSSGEGYGAGVHVGFVAFTGYAPGFAAGYETFNFKVKDLPAGTIEVKFIEGGDTSIVYDVTSYAGSTDLGDGWYQLSIPISDFAATIDANQGFLLGPLGDQGAAFTFLLTDIGFSGTAPSPGITPEAVVYATDPGITEDLAPPAIDNFSSGAVFDGAYAGDADYNPAFQVTSGEGYGAGVHVGFVAFNGYAAGFAAGYGTFEFKAKVNAPASASAFEVKFINGGDTSKTYDLTSYAGSTALGNGWYQVQIPMSDFAATIAANSGFLLGPLGGQAGAFTMLLTDIGFSGTAGGGGGGGTCPPVGAELATNGNFEAGDLSCWEAITNGGTITADNTQNNTAGGSWSAHAVTAGATNPTLKQNFLAEGTVQIGDVIDISFDMKGTAGAGGVIFPKLISEGATGSDGPILETIAVPNANWQTYSYSPTITADVTRGITFEISVVCGAVAGCIADVYIDNVSVQIR